MGAPKVQNLISDYPAQGALGSSAEGTGQISEG